MKHKKGNCGPEKKNRGEIKIIHNRTFTDKVEIELKRKGDNVISLKYKKRLKFINKSHSLNAFYASFFPVLSILTSKKGFSSFQWHDIF